MKYDLFQNFFNELIANENSSYQCLGIYNISKSTTIIDKRIRECFKILRNGYKLISKVQKFKYVYNCIMYSVIKLFDDVIIHIFYMIFI